MDPSELSGKRVSVIGLGRFGGGAGVARWLCGQGARVTVSDMAPAESLAGAVADLADCEIEYHLGGHHESDFLEADLLVVNPAVPKTVPLLQQAMAAGVPWTTEINLFLERCPCPVIGITGSVGKSTTTAMLGEILAGHLPTHVGGNIGRSLLPVLDTIQPDHVAVLELSSFQLEDLPKIGVSPTIALVTNLIDNHLDRHGTMANYADAKQNIYRYQQPGDTLILNRSDAATAAWASDAPGAVKWYDYPDAPIDLLVPGPHNQINAQAALTAASVFLNTAEDLSAGVRGFAGLPHRLQFVTEEQGVRYYNDSKSTTPSGAIVALNSFDPGKTILLAGGYDKQSPFDEVATAAVARAKAVIAFGQTAPKIVAAIESQSSRDGFATEVPDLPSAVALAQGLATAGDVIVLSPACASYDQFTNYEQRGDQFVACVNGQPN